VVLVIFVTWRQGRAIVHEQNDRRHERLDALVAGVTPERPARAPGTSVYLAPSINLVPPALASSLYRYRTLRQAVIILRIAKEDVARVDPQRQATIHPLGKGFWQIVLHYGFMERVDVVGDLKKHAAQIAGVDLENLTFFVGRSIFVEGERRMRPRWRKRLFLWLANSVEEEFEYSRVPSTQLVQIGSQVEV
jgi:KUP system potassium uptake protein